MADKAVSIALSMFALLAAGSRQAHELRTVGALLGAKSCVAAPEDEIAGAVLSSAFAAT
jgi:hypothetical protein